MIGLGNTGKKFAIGTVDDFLNIESSVCDTTTESLSRFHLAPILSSAVSWPVKAGSVYDRRLNFKKFLERRSRERKMGGVGMKGKRGGRRGRG